MSEPGAVYGVELIPADTFGRREVVEGIGSFFHERCYPVGSTRYRRKPMPAGIDDGDE